MTPKTRLVLKILGWTAGAVAVLAVAGGVITYTIYSRYEERAAKFDLTKIDNLAQRSEIFDANGDHYSYFGGENRLVVPLENVSKHFQDALLAREDSRYWEHHGVDSRGVLRAVVTDLRAGEKKQGASTITQQLARNACGLGERSLDRKVLEAILARRIEKQYTKEQILEMYVNRIYFGAGFNGVEAAARGYFGKPAAELTLGESAALAALVRNPNRLAPSRNLEASMEGRNEVLARMAELHMITGDEQMAAQAQQLKVAPPGAMRVADDEIVDAVQRELSNLLAPETLENGGLRVSMTIDPAIQRQAQSAADGRLSQIEAQKGYPHPKKADYFPGPEGEKEKPTDYLQAAVVVIDNRTGAIRAAVGARDYAQSKYSRALASQRQIGSTFKPFVYATAFERGLMPGTLIDDGKISAGEFADLPKKWSPENSDGDYGGMQPASFGLVKSRNTMSVRVGEFASLPKVREMAQAVGLSDHVPDLPVVFLGAFETTARNLTAAYTVFPNNGIYRPAFLITQVQDHAGRVLYEAPRTEKRVLSADSAWMISGILQQVMKTGTAAKAASLGWKKIAAGKTGTTNDFFDAWFVGYTSSLTCGVWVGMDQPQTIMEKGYGAALALPIWVDVMKQMPENRYPAAPLTEGVKFAKVSLCAVSGERATSSCIAQHYGYEIDLPVSRVPRGSCRTHPEPAPTMAALPAPAATSASPQPISAPTSAGTINAATVPAVSSVPEPPAPNPVTAVRQPPVISTNSVTTARPQTVISSANDESPARPANVRQRVPDAPPGVVAVSRGPARTAPDSPATADTQSTPPARSPAATARTRGSDEEPASPPVARSRPPAAAVTQSSPPTRVEVRKAIPVAPPAAATVSDNEAPPHSNSATTPSAQNPLPPGVSERRIVEKMPDGRTRTTTIRTIRNPGKGHARDESTPTPAPAQ